jgi:hypothetical protein
MGGYRTHAGDQGHTPGAAPSAFLSAACAGVRLIQADHAQAELPLYNFRNFIEENIRGFLVPRAGYLFLSDRVAIHSYYNTLRVKFLFFVQEFFANH